LELIQKARTIYLVVVAFWNVRIKNQGSEVSGGVLPAIAFGLSVAARVGIGVKTTSVVGHVLSGVSLGVSTYAFAQYLGGAY
jgi:hypothetical protein